MPKFSVSRSSAFTAQQVYDVVADIEAYPQFVPLCRSATVNRRRVEPNGLVHLSTSLEIAYPKLAILEHLKTEVVLNPVKLHIRSTSDTPPVKHLNSLWRFHSSPQGGCEVEYVLDYQLASRSLQLLLSGMVDWAARKMLAAFEARARAIYAGSPAPVAGNKSI
ncbi:MAG: type II toxin-antitoxin system RatA family toxin [Rhizobiales bacterium]|nr:type II toxin-antitoxin system RatA family toxin [Hyphomicrobiales bacterium]